MQSCLCEILAICVWWITYDHKKLKLRNFIKGSGCGFCQTKYSMWLESRAHLNELFKDIFISVLVMKD